MKIDVTDLLLKSIGAELKIEGSEKISFGKEDDLDLSSPVRVSLKLVNAGVTVLVSGTLKTSVKASCCRCLKEFDLPLSVKIEEEYAKPAPGGPVRRNSKNEGGEIEIELKEKDFIFEIGKDNIIDLDEAVRQTLMVALPIKPLCNNACKGIAASVGGSKKSVDPRLAKLKSFKTIGGK